MIVKEKELLERVMKHCDVQCSKHDIEAICDKCIEEMFQCFVNEESLLYNDYPLFKVKKSKGKINIDSPRTPKNDRIMVSVKIPLDIKSINK